MYDAALGRFHVPDPLAEYHYNYTPFNYCRNNPISFIDPFGLTDTTYIAPQPIEEVVVVHEEPGWLKKAWNSVKAWWQRGDTFESGSTDSWVSEDGQGEETTKSRFPDEVRLWDITDFITAWSAIRPSLTYSLPGDLGEKAANVAEGISSTVELVKTTDEMIKKENTGGDNTSGTGIPISNLTDDPSITVVSTVTSDSANGAAYFTKDSLSNGKVKYTRTSSGGSDSKPSDKNTFQNSLNW